MRDIQDVLSRWGYWAKDNSGIDFSHIAAGFKGLLPQSGSSKISCSDDDGLVVDSAVSKLKSMRKEDELDLIMRHYVFGQSKSSIARSKKCSEREIRRQLQIAEGFIDGCLSMINHRMDMD